MPGGHFALLLPIICILIIALVVKRALARVESGKQEGRRRAETLKAESGQLSR
jgi:hypothetical protein